MEAYCRRILKRKTTDDSLEPIKKLNIESRNQSKSFKSLSNQVHIASVQVNAIINILFIFNRDIKLIKCSEIGRTIFLNLS